MKKIIYFFALFTAAAINSNAQCNASANSFGNNSSTPSYNVTGMVSVVLNNNNTVTLNLGSNFATASGPDVRVFLLDRGTLTNIQLKTTSNFLARPKIEMGLIAGNGAATYTKTIPAGTTISNFNTIYFYCQQFNQFWDFGGYTAFTTGNCSVLSNDNFASLRFKVFPNPATSLINIDFGNDIILKSYAIYAVTGQKVVESSDITSKKSTIDISSLKSGIYYLTVTDNNQNSSIQKIVIEK